MPGLLAMAGLSAGERLLQALLGGKKQKSGYQMSAEEQEIYNAIMGEYRGDVPGSVTAPFVQMGKGIKRKHARHPGLSGIESTELMKVGTARGEAVKGYKQMLLGQAAGVARGGGTRTTEMPTDWGETIGGMGGDLGLILGLMEALKGKRDKFSGFKRKYHDPIHAFPPLGETVGG